MSEPSVRDGGGTTILGHVAADPNVPLPMAGQTAIYTWVESSTVPKGRRDKARRFVDRVARDLGVSRVEILYFRHTGTIPQPRETVWIASDATQPSPVSRTLADAAPGRLFAVQAQTDHEVIAANAPNPNGSDASLRIGINATLRGGLLAAACRHEVRHLAQRRMRLPADRLEADAEQYVMRTVA